MNDVVCIIAEYRKEKFGVQASFVNTEEISGKQNHCSRMT
jgi:hypothetical protein